jgi:hypothetical protein
VVAYLTLGVMYKPMKQKQTAKRKRIIYHGMEMDARMPEIIRGAQKDHEYKINDRIYPRIPWGSDNFGENDPMVYEHACPDCGVRKGQLHVRGCDIEECPVCGKQAIACDCAYDRSYGWGT